MQVRDQVKKIASHSLIRYFLVACVIVVLELIIFQLVYLADKNYIIATVVSFAVAVILNWILSRKVVFGASSHSKFKEFYLVAIASVAGLGIQMLVVWACVSKAGIYPLVGKALSIITSFFWNYWFRSHFIFDKTTPDPVDRVDSSIF